MLGVLIPVHNEEALLGACLQSIQKASDHPHLNHEPVVVVTVLDRCEDRSKAIAEHMKAKCLETEAENVGYARGLGAHYLIEAGARWIACTDADTQVAEDWLVKHLALNADMVCGTVHVSDWGDIPPIVQEKHHQAYQYREGHHHIHGANLGFCPEKYIESGGFQPLPAHEDVALVKAFESIGAKIAWSDQPRVYTSARLTPRAKEGFGDALKHALRTHTSYGVE